MLHSQPHMDIYSLPSNTMECFIFIRQHCIQYQTTSIMYAFSITLQVFDHLIQHKGMSIRVSISKKTLNQWCQFKSRNQRCGSGQDNVVIHIYNEFRLSVKINLYIYLHSRYIWDFLFQLWFKTKTILFKSE